MGMWKPLLTLPRLDLETGKIMDHVKFETGNLVPQMNAVFWWWWLRIARWGWPPCVFFVVFFCVGVTVNGNFVCKVLFWKQRSIKKVKTEGICMYFHIGLGFGGLPTFFSLFGFFDVFGFKPRLFSPEHLLAALCHWRSCPSLIHDTNLRSWSAVEITLVWKPSGDHWKSSRKAWKMWKMTKI